MNFINYLTSAGIPQETVFLLLILPFVAFLVSFFRHFVGVKTFGIYEPIVVAYSLYFISSDFWVGVKFGLPIIILAWIVSEVLKRVLAKSKLHYISKVSLKISIASIVILGLLALAVYFDKNGYFTVSALPIVIILTLIESISLFQIKSGGLRTNIITAETFVVAIMSYALIASNLVQNFIIGYPFLVIVPLIGSYFIGKWKGLRLSEFIRFRNSLKDD
jgi:hypothetical protein